jgi:excisionase family DNA binding protein
MIGLQPYIQFLLSPLSSVHWGGVRTLVLPSKYFKLLQSKNIPMGANKTQKERIAPKGAKIMKNVLTISEVAKKLKMSKSTLYKYSEQGKIPSFKIGTCRRFFEDEIDDFLNRITQEQRENAS